MSASQFIKENAIFGAKTSGAATISRNVYSKLLSSGSLPVPSGTASTVVLTPTITPANTNNSGTSIEQQVTIAGLLPGDIIVSIVEGGAQPTNVSLVGWRLINGTTGVIGLMYKNTTGAAATPYAGVHTITVGRMTGGPTIPFITLFGESGTLVPGASSITGTKVDVPMNSPKLRQRGRVAAWSVYAGYYGPYTATKIIPSADGYFAASMGSFDFETDATVFEWTQVAFGMRFRLLVDGQIATAEAFQLPKNSKSYRVKFDLTQGGTVVPEQKVRRFRIETTNGTGTMIWGALTFSVIDSVSAPSSSHAVRYMAFGDSYTEGYLLTNSWTSSANQVGYLMGWDDAWISGVGGTGYLKAVPSTTVKWRDRINDIIVAAPDVLRIMGSINDAIGAFYTAAQVQAEATLFFDQLCTALPDTVIFVEGVQITQPNRALSASINTLSVDMNTAIKAAIAGRKNVIYIDLQAGPRYTGSGTSAAPLLDGNADRILLADGTHLTQFGHDYDARCFVADARAAIRAAKVV